MAAITHDSGIEAISITPEEYFIRLVQKNKNQAEPAYAAYQLKPYYFASTQRFDTQECQPTARKQGPLFQEFFFDDCRLGNLLATLVDNTNTTLLRPVPANAGLDFFLYDSDSNGTPEVYIHTQGRGVWSDSIYHAYYWLDLSPFYLQARGISVPEIKATFFAANDDIARTRLQEAANRLGASQMLCRVDHRIGDSQYMIGAATLSQGGINPCGFGLHKVSD